ncbi:MAG: serine hydrolase, partial [Planctomycetota bacterium]
MSERRAKPYPLPRHRWRWFLLTLLMGWGAQAMAQRPFDVERLRAIEPLVQNAMEIGDFPGCVILASYRGDVIFREAFGYRQQEPTPEPMTVDTIFDMASITKPVATATSIMRLVEQGKLSLSDPIAKHLPEFGGNGKSDVTVFECLTHQAGFVPDSPLDEYEVPDDIWPNLCRLELVYPPRTKFVYSDVGFQVLGKLVEKLSGSTLDEFTQREVFEPLEMVDTGFRPAVEHRARIAPTEKRDGKWIRGDVHDPRAFAMGNVAGHAGLFSTVDDLAKYARMMLGQGQGGHARVLGPVAIDVMTSAYPSGSSWRGLGWDKQSRFSYNGGDLLSSSAFGHGGFTGTVMWIDPDLDLFFIILSNRLHPDGEGTINRLAGRIANVLVSAVNGGAEGGLQQMSPGETQCGIDVLRDNDFDTLRGLRVGLIANHTSRDRSGKSTARLLQDASDVSLVCLFSPEHGIAGKLDQADIGDTTDEETGVPVYSLYGASREPSPAQLSTLDAVVFDIQDIGTRFYTYISTMGNSMRAAANEGVRFV